MQHHKKGVLNAEVGEARQYLVHQIAYPMGFQDVTVLEEEFRKVEKKNCNSFSKRCG
ncbi:hypothetical protein LguiB_013536 [Lonicera macranthoides]